MGTLESVILILRLSIYALQSIINFSPIEDLHRFGTQFSDIYLRLISCTGSPSGSPSVGNFSWNQNGSFTCSFNYTSSSNSPATFKCNIYISKMKIMYGNEDLEQQEVKTARIFPFINSIRFVSVSVCVYID